MPITGQSPSLQRNLPQKQPPKPSRLPRRPRKLPRRPRKLPLRTAQRPRSGRRNWNGLHPPGTWYVPAFSRFPAREQMKQRKMTAKKPCGNPSRQKAGKQRENRRKQRKAREGNKKMKNRSKEAAQGQHWRQRIPGKTGTPLNPRFPENPPLLTVIKIPEVPKRQKTPEQQRALRTAATPTLPEAARRKTLPIKKRSPGKPFPQKKTRSRTSSWILN